MEFLDFPDVPVLVIPATFELRAKKDESQEVLGQEEVSLEDPDPREAHEEDVNLQSTPCEDLLTLVASPIENRDAAKSPATQWRDKPAKDSAQEHMKPEPPHRRASGQESPLGGYAGLWNPWILANTIS